MVEKLALLSEQATSAAWIAANTLRDAHARTLREERPPSLTGLIGLLRDEDTRRGMAVALRALQTLGRQMKAQRRTTRTPRRPRWRIENPRENPRARGGPLAAARKTPAARV